MGHDMPFPTPSPFANRHGGGDRPRPNFAQISSGSRHLHGFLRPQEGLASNYNEKFRRNGPQHAVVCMPLFPSEFESKPIKADLQWRREGKQAAAAPRTSFPLHHLTSRAMVKVLGMP